MIAIVNGEEGSTLPIYKASSLFLTLVLLSDGDLGPTAALTTARGTPLDLTADTVSVEVYDDVTRKNAAVASLSATISATPTAGLATATVLPAALNFGPGKYYAFVKRTENVGTTVEFSRRFTTLQVG